MSFTFIGIEHVQVAAPKGCESEARRFYGDGLGWKEIEKPDALKARGGVWFQCGGHQVHIGVQSDFVPAAKAHPAFLVRGLERLQSRLAELGIARIADEHRAGEGITRFYVLDPFGNRLEFMEYGSDTSEQGDYAKEGSDSLAKDDEEQVADSKERFTNRAENYVKYRPTYPNEALDFLYERAGFDTDGLIADIGAGTGIFTRLLLERGSHVVAIEPNKAMRDAAMSENETGNAQNADLSQGNAVSKSVQALWGTGSAEQTGLPDQAVDHIVCAQSFHWFDRQAARQEFERILKTSGNVALIWNTRRTTGAPFLEQFEALLLRYGTDYERVGHRGIDRDTLKPFFGGDGPNLDLFGNVQYFDLEGLKGRLLSSSYAPLPGDARYEPMMEELEAIFERNKSGGVVAMVYDTEIYWGTLR